LKEIMTAITTTENNAVVTMGFGSLQSFEFMQRTAKMFSHSSMVPVAYRAQVTKGYGNDVTTEDNPSALPNCIIALNMATRMNADPLMIMQNLHVIEGRPSWSSQFIIAAINSCGRYSPLRFDITAGEEIDASYTTFEWVDRKKVAKTTKTRVRNATCVAWAVELATNTRLESPKVTMEMAVNEGWYGKNGSKWQSMPDLMLRYRSAAFFGRIYAPELLMGLPAAEEVPDMINLEQQADGSYAETSAPVAPAAPAAPMSKSEAKAAAAATTTPPANVEDAAIKTDAPADQPKATAASKADPATGEIPAISANQVKYLQTKIKAIELPESAVEALLMRIGAASLEALTVEQFDTMKAELLAMGA
jgi:hypothetical protein